MKEKSRLGILVSGNGTNLQAILDASAEKDYPAGVRLVISNRPDAYALKRAQKSKVPTALIQHSNYPDRGSFEDALIAELDRVPADLVVLAGFMRVLSPHFVRRYPNRILNIHPALLPSFPGTHAIQKAWEYGVKVTGVTVHFVDDGTDTGPIVLQETVPCDHSKDSLETLEEKIHSVERRLFPEAIRLFAEGRLQVTDRQVLIGKERT